MEEEFILDPDRFLLAAALVDWAALARRDETHMAALKQSRDTLVRGVQLRWLLSPELGYPTEPFEVWRRPALNVQLEKELPVEDETLIVQTLFNWRAFAAPSPMVFIRATLQVTAPQANVIAFAGAPFGSAVVGIETVSSGFRTISFSAPQIACLVLFDGVELLRWVGIDGQDANRGEWTLIERVGLPVDQGEWNGVFGLDADQGPAGMPMPPVDAALSRFSRGAAPFGWQSAFAPGRLAPHWRKADPKAFLRVMEDDVLDGLLEMVTTRPPNLHGTLERSVDLAAEGGGEAAAATFSLLGTLMFAAATDPVASLLAGFGTAVEEIDIPPISVRDVEYFNDPNRSDSDFRVTARFANGLDGQSDKIAFAAIALSPRRVVPPPPPANLSILQEGMRSPPTTDGAWRPVMRLGWDRLPPGLPLRSAAYAHARSVGGARTAQALILPRRGDEALQPIGVTTGSDVPANVPQLRASDDSFAIPGSPAVVPLLYGVAHQDIFGVWSEWRTAPINVQEPPVQIVPVLSASLDTTASAGPCPASLTVEFAWDWAARSPADIRFAGVLYAQARRGDPPLGPAAPIGLQRSLGGAAGMPFEVRFDPAGNAAVDAGGTLQHLSEDGRDIIAGPLNVAGPRRYRLRVDGFSLDFNAAGHIGLALSAMAIERRPPGRAGGWSAPRIASASDPRPPVIATEHEDVLLASMEDAAGRHHALVTWPSAPGAAGYFIYAAQEGKLRADWELAEPRLEQTLSQRLVELRNAFAANPAKRFFTRLNESAVNATSYQATLPRGSKEIHLFLVVGISAGGVESEWPGAGDPMLRKRPIAYAAPQKQVPDAPTLEVRRVADPDSGTDAFRADMRLTTLPGATVDRIDIHRVRSEAAAVELDTMGPPVMTVRSGEPSWTIRALPPRGAVPGQAIGVVNGVDRPAGSWSPFYYRAVAWSLPRPERGLLGGRSKPSAARSVIIPPPGPPDLQPLEHSWPGGDIALIEIATATPAPIEATTLGAHRLRVEVTGLAENGPGSALFAWPELVDGVPGDGSLRALPAAPPASGQSGIWRETPDDITRIRLRIVRPNVDTALSVRFQLDDPLGRATERIVAVPAGSPLPPLAFGVVAVRRIAGKGFIVRAPINLPLKAPPEAGYRLRAAFRPHLAVPGPLPRPMGRGVTLDVDYADVPQLRPLEDPFAGTVPLPVRREAAGRTGALLSFYLRGQGGSLRATLGGVDGAPASFMQEVP
ncbi:hypothetical protein [Neoaquamicrobium sediminum]|uniref:Tail protein n=1 Tax=Neoaquamicrobium sediminum TaxID=1849104 RepID=A0ABV3X159_9HYPH